MSFIVRTEHSVVARFSLVDVMAKEQQFALRFGLIFCHLNPKTLYRLFLIKEKLFCRMRIPVDESENVMNDIISKYDSGKQILKSEHRFEGSLFHV
jgi:hypothetical protein